MADPRRFRPAFATRADRPRVSPVQSNAAGARRDAIPIYRPMQAMPALDVVAPRAFAAGSFETTWW